MCVALVFSGTFLAAQVNSKSVRIPYHTSLRKNTDSGGTALVDGEVYFKLVIYSGVITDDSTWEPVWSPNPGYITGLDPDRIDPVPEPTNFIKVDVDRGVASVGIGDDTITVWSATDTELTAVPDGGGDPEIVTMDPLTASMFEGGHFYLKVWLSEDGTTFNELSPDVTIMGTAMALRASVAEEVVDGALTKEAMETDLKDLLTQLETFSQYMDQVAVTADNDSDSGLTGLGFEVVKSFPADPWENVTATDEPTGRLNHQATWTGTQLLVWGGRSSNSGFRMGTGAIFDPDTSSWETMSPRSPYRRLDRIEMDHLGRCQ